LQEQIGKKVLWLILAGFWFLVGIFSKENAITFVAIIPVAIVVFGRNSFEEDLKKAALLALPSLLLSLFFWFGIRKPILGIAASLPPMPELMNDPFMKLVNGRYEPFTFAEKLNTCLYTWGMYLKLLVLPHPLTNDYYPKHIHMIQGGQMLMVVFSAVAHVGMAWYGIKALLERQPIAFAIVFYAATFSVVSNLFFPIGTTMAERFMFLPSLGFSLACALGVYALGQLWQGQKNRILFLGLLLIGLLYGAKTLTRNFVWFDDYTLFTTDIAYSPNSAKLNNAVAGVLQDHAATISDSADVNQMEREELYRDAKKHALKAIELHPTYNSAWLLLGNAHVFLGNILENKRNKPDEAIKEYNEAIKAYREVKRPRPDHPDVQRNLTVVYRDKGKLLGQKLGRVAEAVQTLEEGLKENDKDLELLRLAGVANGVAGNHSQALKYFEKGLSLKPDHVALLYNQAVAYRIMAQISAQQGNAAAAAENSRKADEIDAKWKAIDPNYNPAQAQDEAKITNTER
jgi:tetratricopeptide (TPR) repeat protein